MQNKSRMNPLQMECCPQNLFLRNFISRYSWNQFRACETILVETINWLDDRSSVLLLIAVHKCMKENSICSPNDQRISN